MIESSDGHLSELKDSFLFPFPQHPRFLIDARQFGNEARFVRFSCKPNAHLQCVILQNDNDKNHSGDEQDQIPLLCLYSSSSAKSGDEITVGFHELIGQPYDKDLHDDKIAADCACESYDTCLFRVPVPVINNGKMLHPDDPLSSESEFEEISSPNKMPMKYSSSSTAMQVDDTDIFSKPDRLLTREERKIRDELARFAKMEGSSMSVTNDSSKSLSGAANVSPGDKNKKSKKKKDKGGDKEDSGKERDDLVVDSDTMNEEPTFSAPLSSSTKSKSSNGIKVYAEAVNWKKRMVKQYLPIIKETVKIDDDEIIPLKLSPQLARRSSSPMREMPPISTVVTAAFSMKSPSASARTSPLKEVPEEHQKPVALSPVKMFDEPVIKAGVKRPADEEVTDLHEATLAVNTASTENVQAAVPTEVSKERHRDSIVSATTSEILQDHEAPVASTAEEKKEERPLQTKLSLKDYKKKRKIMEQQQLKDNANPTSSAEDNIATSSENLNISASSETLNESVATSAEGEKQGG